MKLHQFYRPLLVQRINFSKAYVGRTETENETYIS